MKVVRVVPKPVKETYDIRGLTWLEYQQIINIIGFSGLSDTDLLYNNLRFIQTEQAP